MCKDVRYWVKDPDAGGTHNTVPISCDEYIRKLEGALISAYPPDSLRVRRLQNDLGILDEGA